MIFKGQKVKFKRTNGTWSVGVVKETNGDFVIVQWLSQDGLQIATKKVHKLLTKPINSIFTKRNSFIIIFVVVFLLLLDSFFYLKKVNSFYY